MAFPGFLIVPGLVPALAEPGIQRLPNLEWMLAHGNTSCSVATDVLELWLPGWDPVRPTALPSQRQPPLEHSTTLALHAARQAGIADSAKDWILADPIHLQVEDDRLLLVERYGLQLEASESAALIAALNDYFVHEGMSFTALTTDRWLVGLETAQTAGLVTTPPLARAGRNIDGYLPAGPNAGLWNARFNAAQMVLHENALNLEREQRRQRVVSGVWFWNAPYVTLPASVRIVDRLRAPSAYGDFHGWATAALELDETLFAPALQALHLGQLDSLTLLGVEGRVRVDCVLRSRHRWRFWRQERPLTMVHPLAR